MIGLKGNKSQSPFTVHLLTAVLAWGGVAFVVVKTKPSSLASFLAFFIFLALAIFSTAVYPFFLLGHLFRQQKSKLLSTSRRRAWLLATGTVILIFIQLFRLTNPLHTFIVLSIFVLGEFYLSH
jgi:hypothetical protein